jgi:hypothetical protein
MYKHMPKAKTSLFVAENCVDLLEEAVSRIFSRNSNKIPSSSARLFGIGTDFAVPSRGNSFGYGNSN